MEQRTKKKGVSGKGFGEEVYPPPEGVNSDMSTSSVSLLRSSMDCIPPSYDERSLYETSIYSEGSAGIRFDDS